MYVFLWNCFVFLPCISSGKKRSEMIIPDKTMLQLTKGLYFFGWHFFTSFVTTRQKPSGVAIW